MLREVITYLALQPGLTVVDGTVGAGGHAQQILTHIQPGGRLIGLDRDPMMLEFAAAHLSSADCLLRHASYADLPAVLRDLERESVDRILVDLGLSSDQLADRERGFGIQRGGRLDLRFDTTAGRPAWELLAELDAETLADVLWKYGEERYSRQIAREIERVAHSGTPVSAEDIVAAVERGVPVAPRRKARRHPATRVFQALRIHTNAELEHLQRALDSALHECLAPEGRLVVLTFHSLEDRMVKNAFRDHQRWQTMTSKPVRATTTEQRINPRSRTAKLRVAKRRA